ncbi:MAG TPA: hypothetical protein VD816_00400 [Ohtaekwangia sp.]|nr:hypothetical protein [Ohtaekwangia sp.]
MSASHTSGAKLRGFLQTEKEQWLPIHQELIRQGRKTAWYLYRVRYPEGIDKKYDYVRFDVFTDWKQVEAPYRDLAAVVAKVHPRLKSDELIAHRAASGTIVWEQLHQVIDEAVTTKVPSQYIIVNEVLTVPGAEREYVTTETTYFKPFHAERVNQGLMNNWSLYKPSLPYGTNYDHDYVTLNGFKSWDDITRNPPPVL